MKTTTTRVLGVLALAISMPALAGAQARVGVATTVVGPVTVTRAATSPAPLKFRDDVMLNDRVATGDQAFARMLLGGKAIVTAREHSIVTITETPGVSTIDLVSGRISVAVDKARMRRGDVVEIKTPNAVSGIRGTIVVAEVAGGVSTITVLRGLVDVYRRDPATGKAIGKPIPLGARESVTVTGGVLPARPRPISAERARTLANDFTAPVRPVLPSPTLAADEMSRAVGTLGRDPRLTSDAAPNRAVKTETSAAVGATNGALSTATSATTGALSTTSTLTNSTLGNTPALGTTPTLGSTPTLGTIPTLSTAPTLSTTPTLSTAPPLTTAPAPQVPRVMPPTTTLPNPTGLLR